MQDDFPIGLYRRTTAHWREGKVTTLFVKQSGQGSKLVLEQSNEATVTLGGEFVLVLQPVEVAEPPIVEIPPEFPELPTPEVPVKPEPPIYEKPELPTPEVPVKPEHPIYEKPGETKPAPEPAPEPK